MNIKIFCIIIFWSTCSVFVWGASLGYFTYKFPASNHVTMTTIEAIGGPLALPAVFFLTHGRCAQYWRLVPLSTEERWQKFHERWPSLSRQEFRKEYE